MSPVLCVSGRGEQTTVSGKTAWTASADARPCMGPTLENTQHGHFPAFPSAKTRQNGQGERESSRCAPLKRCLAFARRARDASAVFPLNLDTLFCRRRRASPQCVFGEGERGKLSELCAFCLRYTPFSPLNFSTEFSQGRYTRGTRRLTYRALATLSPVTSLERHGAPASAGCMPTSKAPRSVCPSRVLRRLLAPTSFSSQCTRESWCVSTDVFPWMPFWWRVRAQLRGEPRGATKRERERDFSQTLGEARRRRNPFCL